tara:strand:+ start:2357 stop:3601 length:1245 start_codon:yes stop_codon:yes gene_type:complete
MAHNYIAVLAIGGKGTRLKASINEIPKPLYPISGESTLYRACKQLSYYGIQEIICTVQHKKDSFKIPIQKISNELKQNIHIFVEDSPLGECGALWKLKERLSEDFLFINGDLIFEIDLIRLIDFHQRLSSKLTLVTHTSSHPNDSDLISAPNGTTIEKLYLKSSNHHHLAQAFLGNAGIALISKELINKFPAPTSISNSSLFQYFANKVIKAKEKIYSYNTTEYIKDMGTPKRLKEVEDALLSGIVSRKCYKNKQRALFLDRDNTIIKCNEGDYITEKSNIQFFDQRITLLAKIAKSYDLICLITNQPQISMGRLSIENLDAIHAYIVKHCISLGLKIDSISYCPHHPHKGYDGEISILKKDCFCRKPNPGLILEESYFRNIDLKKSLFIGDSINDEKAAEKVHCEFKNIATII